MPLGPAPPPANVILLSSFALDACLSIEHNHYNSGWHLSMPTTEEELAFDAVPLPAQV